MLSDTTNKRYKHYYQQVLDGLSSEQTQEIAQEFADFVHALRDMGVNVITVKDTTSTDTPDSIFPNNWVSFHRDGKVGLYPMCAPNRRLERRRYF